MASHDHGKEQGSPLPVSKPNRTDRLIDHERSCLYDCSRQLHSKVASDGFLSLVTRVDSCSYERIFPLRNSTATCSIISAVSVSLQPSTCVNKRAPNPSSALARFYDGSCQYLTTRSPGSRSSHTSCTNFSRFRTPKAKVRE